MMMQGLTMGEAAEKRIKYGYLYNWHAVVDTRNIAPVGWHVPTDAEWTILTNYVTANPGTSINVAKALAATTDWTISTNVGAIGNNLSINNYSGFNARPGGVRYGVVGPFGEVGNYGYWWSSTASSTSTAYHRYLIYGYINVYRSSLTAKSNGYAVRLVRDEPDLSASKMVGNDGQKYNTVNIGTQTWMAENLAETKYRGGADITNVTDNTAWTALTTSARCAYGNNESNVLE